MADLTITAANVIAASDATIEHGYAGEAVAAGKYGYKSSTTKRWMLADSNSAAAEARRAGGVFLNNAGAGQPVAIATHGETLTAGTAYYLSDTPGGICPLADVGSGEYVCLLGLAKSTTVLALDIQYPGVSL